MIRVIYLNIKKLTLNSADLLHGWSMRGSFKAFPQYWRQLLMNNHLNRADTPKKKQYSRIPMLTELYMTNW